ncbi:MAG TPA: GNAT family N-acetyltransferase [Terriglobales bacterium]|nr:GNAT family N-acetyltransferase [Terriglobales bacterium]
MPHIYSRVIRPCTEPDTGRICAIINDGAQAYKGIIPADCWHEPYMPMAELQHELQAGVKFWCYEDDAGELVGVMGTQPVRDVTLIRHAYVRTANRQQGIGAKLLAHLRGLTARPILIGTWADATWAVAFYQKHGFRLLTPLEKNRLLKLYWTISQRQIETSVVLADSHWPAS